MKEENFRNVKKNISPAVIARLSRYYRFLRDLKNRGVQRVSSAELAKMMDLTASQIRQDFNCFGGFGQQGYGYNVEHLFEELRMLLGAEDGYTAAIVGAGNLGSALAHAQTFVRRGITVVGIFDRDEKVIGREMGGVRVQSIDDVWRFYAGRPFDIAVLCVPKEAAQECADLLTGLGVRAIWNFTGIEIKVPEECVVENTHLGDALMTVSYKLHRKNEESRK